MIATMSRSLQIIENREIAARETRLTAVWMQMNRFEHVLGDPPPMREELGWALRDLAGFKTMRELSIPR